MKHQDYKKPLVIPARQERVTFKDGMIVTAEDLHAAMHYPLGVFQTLIRAFFGCGIVCGFKVGTIDGKATCTENDVKKNVWCLEIQPGVALDCHGFPLELCKPVTIDLTPDPCSCDDPPTCLCIAIRRYMPADDEQKNSSCKENESGQAYESRKPEQVMIKVFDPTKSSEHPTHVCMQDADSLGYKSDDSSLKDEKGYQSQQDEIFNLYDWCKCMKSCPSKDCCGDSWVLLACIELDECGIKCIDNRLRKYVKPIDCLCLPEEKECIERPREEGYKKMEPPKAPMKKRPSSTKAAQKKEG